MKYEDAIQDDYSGYAIHMLVRLQHNVQYGLRPRSIALTPALSTTPSVHHQSADPQPS